MPGEDDDEDSDPITANVSSCLGAMSMSDDKAAAAAAAAAKGGDGSMPPPAPR
jgi:hypothetical protein